ncbi:MAG: prepilin-type N-terminal cleavage/methylation domain-containing protein [Thermodesulfobacteriota bacterium]
MKKMIKKAKADRSRRERVYASVRGRGFTPPIASNERGFTIVEILIAMFIGAIVAAALFTLYNTFFAQTRTQDLRLESQQNARAAMDIMERELVNIGLDVKDGEALSIALTSEIEFIYTDPEDDSDLIDYAVGSRLKVKYDLDGSGAILQRTQSVCSNPACTSYSSTTGVQEIISDVSSFTITYYNQEGTAFNPTTDTLRATVRFATLTLTTETSEITDSGAKETFTLRAHLRLRNLGIGDTTTDNDAPVAVASLKVRDPGACEELQVQFPANTTDGDLQGYKIYYGTSSGSNTYVVDIKSSTLSGTGASCSNSSNTITCTLIPTLPAFTISPSDGSGDVTYYFTIKAYDKSFNHSTATAEVYGNPDPSISSFAGSSNDSTINVIKPVVVASFASVDGSADGYVDLSWAASTDENVVGYRVYRSTGVFSTFPIDPSDSTITWVAGETGTSAGTSLGLELSRSDVTMTDTTSGLLGCSMYYYAIAPVNCDATLIADDAGDGDDEKYLEANYAVAYGDGSGGVTDSPSDGSTDTSPPDTTAPDAPVLGVGAGWRRVSTALTQPSSTDLSHTCIYVEEAASYPVVRTDTGIYPLVSNCYDVAPNGQLVPDSSGSWTTAEQAVSQTQTFWHDSMYVEDPGAPMLVDNATYSYSAVSFDICGNGSVVTDAQATTTLCGEDPDDGGSKPYAVSGLTVECCDTPVVLEWTAVSSTTSLPSSDTNPYDLAGYRVLRGTTTSAASAVVVSGSAPIWNNYYSDSSIVDGGPYYYWIATTDCPYERANPSDATIVSNVASDYIHSTRIGPVYPGSLLRDEKCAGSVPCTKDDHREVLTGVDVASDNTTSVSSTNRFYHDTVTIFLNNSAAGTMTVTNYTAAWENVSAKLVGLSIGGGRGTSTQISTTIPDSNTVTTSIGSYTRAIWDYSLANIEIDASDRYVPVTLTFADASGDPVDMRQDTIIMELHVINDSTPVPTGDGCYDYLTVSDALTGIAVPLGPTIFASTQNLPDNPTFPTAIPGASGLNTVPNGSDADLTLNNGSAVTITTTITPQTTHAVTGLKVPIDTSPAPRLRYISTANTVTTAPTTGYTTVSMTNTAGFEWTADIPDQPSKRVWYFIAALDEDGNFDRDPERGSGVYSYDQIPYVFEPCDFTPDAPTGLTATAGGTGPSAYTVALSWTGPTTYTDASTIDIITPLDTLKYRVYDGDGIQVNTDQTAITYTATGLGSGSQSYTVAAINSCGTPNVSAETAVASACTGSSGFADISIDPTTILAGESFTVTITDCLAATSGYELTLDTLNVDLIFAGFSITSLVPETNAYVAGIPETAIDSAKFVTTVTTSTNVVDAVDIHVLTVDTISVYYPYAVPDTVIVEVREADCTDIPGTPGSFSGVATGQNVDLTWTEPDNTNGTSMIDLAGYKIYERVCAKDRPNCTGGDVIVDWFLRDSPAAGATSVTLSADQGNFSQANYYFRIEAFDNCGTPNTGSTSTWVE